MKLTMPKLSDGWMYVPISKETWELLSHFGNQEETADEGIKTALKIASRSSAKESSDKVLDNRMIAWIRNGERGISSEVIFEVLANHPLLIERYDFSTPSDASDFYRCFELVRSIPEWEERLDEVSKKHPHWNLIVEHWQELKTCLINDIADDGRSCNRLLNELNKYRYAPEKYKELRTKEREQDV